MKKIFVIALVTGFITALATFTALKIAFGDGAGLGDIAAEKPEWNLGNRWVFNYKNGAGLVGTFKTEILGQVRQDGRSCWTVGLTLTLELNALRAEQHQYILVENFDIIGLETISSIGAIGQTNGQLILLEPPMKSYCWPIEIGQDWSGDFQMVVNDFAHGEMKYKVKVIARETITVPAGKFETFKIIETFISGQGNEYKREKWYSPQVQNLVKEISYLSNGSLEYVKELQDYRLR